MGDSPATSKLLCCFPSTERRDQAIDNTLANVTVVLNALDKVKDLIPVTGVAILVPILRSIVDQVTVRGYLMDSPRRYCAKQVNRKHERTASQPRNSRRAFVI